MFKMLWLFLTALVVPTLALDNGLALTPPMGWLSWQRFLCNTDCDKDPDNCISEKLYRDMADRLYEDGYLAAGYEFVNIDDCWMSKQRDPNTKRLEADPIRFKSGIKALADYVHSKGLKLGIYQDCGIKTCAGYPGSLNYYDVDTQAYAEWGVDMLKLDGCYSDPKDMDALYPQMTAALNKTGKPIIYSCSWPDYQRASGMKPNYKYIGENCNLWRNFDDIADSWTSVSSIIDFVANNQDTLIEAVGPGKWNDPDMLVLGNFGLSYDQSKAQMGLWAIFAAPLLMSNDLRRISPEIRDILVNKDIIAVNQDPLGLMGKRIYSKSSIEIWRRPITPTSGKDYSYALVFFNRRDMGGPVSLQVKVSDLGLTNPNGYTFKDLFKTTENNSDFLVPSSNLTVVVNPSGITMFTATLNK